MAIILSEPGLEAWRSASFTIAYGSRPDVLVIDAGSLKAALRQPVDAAQVARQQAIRSNRSEAGDRARRYSAASGWNESFAAFTVKENSASLKTRQFDRENHRYGGHGPCHGVPKVMVSTLCQRAGSSYVGVRDIFTAFVTDLCGLDRFTRRSSTLCMAS